MKQINHRNYFTVGNTDNFFSDTHGTFAPDKFILSKHGTCSNRFQSTQKYSIKIFEYLYDRAEIVASSFKGNLDSAENYLNNCKTFTVWFFYKNSYIVISSDSYDDDELPHGISWYKKEEESKGKEKRKCEICVYTPVKFPPFDFSEFAPFIKNDSDETNVSLFIKNSYGDLAMEPLQVNVPKSLNIALNYGENFVDISEKIIKNLNNNKTGLYMFHGDPGTGKSTYIKYLAGKCKSRRFIYIPTSMLESFVSDPSCLSILLNYPKSVLILEDAEKLIMKRENDGMDASVISSLLNLSDGILSDILNVSLILTYNCDHDFIDSALKRKGRLQIDYKFNKLTIKESQRLIDHNNLNYSATEPMSLADIYNIHNQVDYIAESDKKQTKKIGFI